MTAIELFSQLPGVVLVRASGNEYELVMQDGGSRAPTQAEIDAAQVVLDKATADAATLANLRTQAIAAVNTLKTIQGATNPTNAQVIQAVKDLALIQEKVIRVVFEALT